MKYYLLVLVFFSLSVDAMGIPEFISTKEAWEAGYASTVTSYSDTDLKTHFTDLRLDTNVPVPTHIDIVCGY